MVHGYVKACVHDIAEAEAGPLLTAWGGRQVPPRSGLIACQSVPVPPEH